MSSKTKRMNVQFNNECPKLGSGWRVLDVKVGRKWVYARCPGTDRRVRFSRKQWDTISSNAKEIA